MVVIAFVELAGAGKIISLGAIGIIDIDRHTVVDRTRGPHRGVDPGAGECIADGTDVGAVETVGDRHQSSGQFLGGQRSRGRAPRPCLSRRVAASVGGRACAPAW